MVEYTTNLVSEDTFDTRVQNTMHQICDILLPHMGPKASYAAIPRMTSSGSIIHEFSKDGITILEHTKFDDLVCEGLRTIVTYIGQKIDMTCHDGTTTAMWAFASIVGDIYNLYLSNRQITPLDHPTFTRHMKDLTDKIRSRLEECRITPTSLASQLNIDPLEARRRIIYQQALISSKGNIALADVVAQVGCSYPLEEMYGLYHIETVPYEQKTLEYSVVDHDEDLSFGVYVPNMVYNKSFRTAYEGNATLYAFDTELHSESPLYQQLLQTVLHPLKARLVSQCLKPEDLPEDILIVYQGEAPAGMLEAITYVNQLLKADPDPQIRDRVVAPIRLTHSDPSTLRYIDAIFALRDIPYPSTTQTLTPITGCSVRIENHQMFISGLYQKTDGFHHPYYDHQEDHPHYTAFLADLKAFLDRETSQHARSLKSTTQALTTYITIYRYLISQRWSNVVLIGPTHDITSGRSEIQDVYGSIVSSLKSGCVVDGVSRLAYWFYQYTSQLRDPCAEEILYTIPNAFDEIVTETIGPQTWSDKPYEQDILYGQVYCYPTDTSEGSVKTTSTQVFLDNPDHPILIQPIEGYYELLTRLYELVPKLCCTAQYISRIETPSG